MIIGNISQLIRHLILGLVIFSGQINAHEKEQIEEKKIQNSQTSGERLPSMLDKDAPLAFNTENIVAAPILFSNPALGAGLTGILGYFYPQTEQEKAAQPPSISGIGLFHSNNKSWGVALAHAGYWDDNNWNFKGGAAYTNLKLPLASTNISGEDVNLNWNLDGSAVFTQLNRRVYERWYFGINSIYINLDQRFTLDIEDIQFELGEEVKSIGLGASILFDSRDLPSNAYNGLYFKFNNTLFDESFGNDSEFTSYAFDLKGYHPAAESVTLAWKVQGCYKNGNVPLWAACKLGLRGFSSTEYMSLESIEVETEARWRFSPRWGAVAFLGAGFQSEPNQNFADNVIESYGIGLRFMIQTTGRVNLRLDYAQSSTGDEAIYFSVGEAF